MQQLLLSVINVYVLAIVARIVLSYFPLSPGGAMAAIYSFLYAVTEPVLGPVRRVIPPMGGFDLSPIVVMVALRVLGGAIREQHRLAAGIAAIRCARMDVSPRALRAVTFREKLRGYHPDDVDQFLERVSEGIAALQAKLDDALTRAERAELERSTAIEGEDAVQRTLVLAQRTADLALKEAREEAARLARGGAGRRGRHRRGGAAPAPDRHRQAASRPQAAPGRHGRDAAIRRAGAQQAQGRAE